ncbi:hypothetical protein FB451DRAFT_1180521 [Mycena latifolia]|nr:hypothetical protein FB451DRAFT_1180521 [Mycena latifolia]
MASGTPALGGRITGEVITVIAEASQKGRTTESVVACVEEANDESIPRVRLGQDVEAAGWLCRCAGRGIDRFAVRCREANIAQTANERQKLPVDACREDSAKSSWTRAKRSNGLELGTGCQGGAGRGRMGRMSYWEEDDTERAGATFSARTRSCTLARRPQRRRGEGIETLENNDGSVLSQGASLHSLLEEPAAGGADPPVTRTHVGRHPGWMRGSGTTRAGNGAATARAADARAAAMLQRPAHIVPYPLVIRRGVRLLFVRASSSSSHTGNCGAGARRVEAEAEAQDRSTLLDKLLHSTNDRGRPQIAPPIRQGRPSLSVEEGKEQMEGARSTPLLQILQIAQGLCLPHIPSSALYNLGQALNLNSRRRLMSVLSESTSPQDLGHQREELSNAAMQQDPVNLPRSLRGYTWGNAYLARCLSDIFHWLSGSESSHASTAGDIHRLQIADTPNAKQRTGPYITLLLHRTHQ